MFDDIYFPLVYLPEPCAFDPKERSHIWLLRSEATSSHELLDSPLADGMYIDVGDVLLVRVNADEYMTMSLDQPKAHEGVQQAREVRLPPYTVICPMSEQGLGPVLWWRNAGVETMDKG
ncbi:uncharacterized protein BXZ73DRAFT_56618 [Epithele typhae]|uniref:uncharacterized protein n=1 Tax=Epithele typhae TaxID=378194 RepID=UPI00200780F6|nr:uncharacterized protein BXZ73DRAFT_56618 [Epithele typhae]KAH9912055.1 hypothetical protein BXZ73DRAFT_56618 [Epithele typhae]